MATPIRMSSLFDNHLLFAPVLMGSQKTNSQSNDYLSKGIVRQCENLRFKFRLHRARVTVTAVNLAPPGALESNALRNAGQARHAHQSQQHGNNLREYVNHKSPGEPTQQIPRLRSTRGHRVYPRKREHPRKGCQLQAGHAQIVEALTKTMTQSSARPRGDLT
jgi:hypothetical protein